MPLAILLGLAAGPDCAPIGMVAVPRTAGASLFSFKNPAAE